MMNYKGNIEILELEKTAFLCSRKVPADIVLKSYDWAKQQREQGCCIVSGNHSEIEKDVFEILFNCSKIQKVCLYLSKPLATPILSDLPPAKSTNTVLFFIIYFQ